MDIIDKINNLQEPKFNIGTTCKITGYRRSGLRDPKCKVDFPIGSTVKVIQCSYVNDTYNPHCYDKCDFCKKFNMCVYYEMLTNKKESKIWSCRIITNIEDI